MKIRYNTLLNSFPVTRLKDQIITGTLIGLYVSFILIVFQPFGTYEFKMNYKLFFLFGYGVVCAISYSLYYILLMMIIPKWFEPQRWNILKEIITIIPALIIMSLASFYYYSIVLLNFNINTGGFGYFFLLSMIVFLIPSIVLYFHKYLKSKLTTVKQSKDLKSYIISIDSNNKKEKTITIKSEELIYIKSDGNYIEIVLKNIEKPYLIRNSLNYVENKLPKNEFLKIHRSYIVNIKALDSLILNGSSYAVKLIGTDVLIPLSRSTVKTVRSIVD